MIKRTKTQAVHRGDRSRAHRENVSQDAANSGGCTLKWLDKRRMIVRLDLEGCAPAVTDIDDAGVFTRRHDNALALSGQTAQMYARRFVGTMLRPHHREDAQLDERRFATHQRLDTSKLFRREVVSGNYVGSDRFHKKL